MAGCNAPRLCCSYNTIGTWWWDNTLSTSQYLSFAKDNGVTDIYYCDSTFGQTTANFIAQANNLNISVHFLCGEYQWLENSAHLFEKIENFITYQTQYPNFKFAGIHLDIEPHQHPNFNEERTSLITSLITIAHALKTTYPGIVFDYDIPFWFNDEITFNLVKKPAYAHMIDIANQVHIMSYRDTAQGIYNVSKDEILYANSVNKPIALGLETKSSEGNSVSFMEEGKKIMYQEIENLHSLAPNVTINIHHIKDWYMLKN